MKIRDYRNNLLLKGGLCFSQKEFNWFVTHICVKNFNIDYYCSKNCEIYYECDNALINLYKIYQCTRRQRSLMLININEINVLFHSRRLIDDQFQRLMKPSKTVHFEEPMDMDNEPKVDLY